MTVSLPLRRVVITREKEQGRLWLDRLERAGIAATGLPLVEFVPLSLTASVNPDPFDWILFASPQAVRAFKAVGLGGAEARMAGLGTGTTTALAQVGWNDALQLATGDGAEFAAAFAERVPAPARILLPGPRRRRPQLPAGLQAAGFAVEILDLYETVPVAAQQLPLVPAEEGDVFFFCSPSTVAAFIAAWAERPPCVAIGETTARAALAAGFEPLVADSPDLEAMVQAAGLDPEHQLEPESMP